MSGLVNSYNFDFNNHINCPIKSMWLHTDRAQSTKNYLNLTINQKYKNNESLDFIRLYIIERFQHIGSELVTYIYGRYSSEVLSGRVRIGDEAPNYIKVSNYIDVRRVIDNLFQNGEMTATNRADLEPALRELEKSAAYSIGREKSISIAQKDLIIDFIKPYIDVIKEYSPDNQSSSKWLKQVAGVLQLMGPDHGPRATTLLGPGPDCRQYDEYELHESLFFVAKVYVSMAELESAFEQLGESIPSQSIIQQTIMDMIN